MRKTIIATSAIGLLLAGCVGGLISAADSAKINIVLTQLGNTLITDLQQQHAVALAATPPDTAGAACAGTMPTNPTDPTTGTGALSVAAAIQQVEAVTAGKQVGTFTAAEIATLYQPGSPQFNWATETLETACIAKVHQTNQAINSTSGIITALPSVLALAAAPVGM
jgi:hypothetical protein